MSSGKQLPVSLRTSIVNFVLDLGTTKLAILYNNL